MNKGKWNSAERKQPNKHQPSWPLLTCWPCLTSPYPNLSLTTPHQPLTHVCKSSRENEPYRQSPRLECLQSVNWIWKRKEINCVTEVRVQRPTASHSPFCPACRQPDTPPLSFSSPPPHPHQAVIKTTSGDSSSLVSPSPGTPPPPRSRASCSSSSSPSSVPLRLRSPFTAKLLKQFNALPPPAVLKLCKILAK